MLPDVCCCYGRPLSLMGLRRHPSGQPSLACADPARLQLVRGLGRSGTDAAEALAPYEVFARSVKFSVYIVAATHAPVP